MTYLPSNFIDSNNLYSYKDNILTVYKNCSNNSCTCNEIYTNFDYNISEDFICSSSNITTIPYTNFTDNFYYRVDFDRIMILFYILCFFIIWCPLKIFMRFFRRFN